MIRTAHAIWQGNLIKGIGTLDSPSGALNGNYTFASRFEDGKGTNPEELIAAAHAGCFSMALSGMLSEKGFTPQRVATTAKVDLGRDAAGFKIMSIELNTEADVPNIDAKLFHETAELAKKGCPISRALASVEIRLNATLLEAQNIGE